MMEFSKALDIIVDHAPGPERVEEIPLDQAFGRTLGENRFCTRAMPPFDKAAMDGFAVRSADLGNTPATLAVAFDVPAGRFPDRPLGPGQAAAVMTGAPVPDGADAVVQVEWTSGFGGPEVTIRQGPVMPGLNISPKGEILRLGEVALKQGARLGVEEIALLASLGIDPVPVFSLPSAAVITTGDELIPPSRRDPGPSEIYDSNGPALAGFLREMGIEPVLLDRVKDDRESMRSAVARGLRHDCLLISGGVSAGAYDFVEEVLAALEVKIHVRQIAMKPGKPTVFGTRFGKVVFGVPGNPVSAIQVARLLVRPALQKMLGQLHGVRSHYRTPTVKARLLAEIRKKPDRLWFVSGVIRFGEGVEVAPLEGHGSADLPNASRGNCLILAPRERSVLEKGSLVDVVVWERSL